MGLVMLLRANQEIQEALTMAGASANIKETNTHSNCLL
jgi:hypothetical protein